MPMIHRNRPPVHFGRLHDRNLQLPLPWHRRGRRQRTRAIRALADDRVSRPGEIAGTSLSQRRADFPFDIGELVGQAARIGILVQASRVLVVGAQHDDLGKVLDVVALGVVVRHAGVGFDGVDKVGGGGDAAGATVARVPVPVDRVAVLVDGDGRVLDRLVRVVEEDGVDAGRVCVAYGAVAGQREAGVDARVLAGFDGEAPGVC